VPKPILPDDLRLDMRAGAAAARLIDAKLQEVRLYVGPAMTGDVDGIHDMRVAMKRLRETLRLFRKLLPRRQGEKLLPLVDQLNDALGRVRDPDVVAGHAEWLVQQDPETREIVNLGQRLWAEERARAQRELTGLWLQLKDDPKLLRRLDRMAKATAKRKQELNRAPLQAFAYMALTARMERTQEPLQAALDSHDPTALHRLRITVKRLKYTIEPFLTVLPELSKPYPLVSDLQESLGLVHDFDVLDAALSDALAQAGQTEDDMAQRVAQIVCARRAELHRACLAQLQRFATGEWRQQVLDALD
jgi:CHAD domain-containing protein